MNFSELDYLRVACASPVVSIGSPTDNATEINTLARSFHNEAVSIGVFPELCITGYSAEDLFFTDALLRDTVTALEYIARENPLPLLIVGAPWRLDDGRLLNCGFAIGQGRILGAVPKSVHPNYSEFYDLRWFSPGASVNETVVHPTLGTFDLRCDQLFEVAGCSVGIEICEDLWAPHPPGTNASLAGALIIANLSASNELISKADYRRDLVRLASARNMGGYIYASSSATESTKDVVFSGHCMVGENGQMLAESARFNLSEHHLMTDLDIGKLRHDRAQNKSFSQGSQPSFRINRIASSVQTLTNLRRVYPRQPFVPEDETEFNARAQDILAIQATGLARRMQSIGTHKLVIGLSGGLDSTLAYLVCLDALHLLSAPVDGLHALTMPGPGTTSKTNTNAHRLTQTVHAPITEIDIGPAVAQHLTDLDHDGDHDVVFENAQARERTQLLFNYANKVAGIVVGTGDLSELALGWCTFNADHMASYNVNASVPKTLMAYLVRWYATHRANPELAVVLQDVLATPISPELLPPKDGQISQQTEALVGPYELHDFFLFHFLRNGANATKIYSLALLSFNNAYTGEEIRHWLKQFFTRFFTQQFKRTTLPPGPKVGSVSLSPRGDWRMPDEATVKQILAEVDNLG